MPTFFTDIINSFICLELIRRQFRRQSGDLREQQAIQWEIKKKLIFIIN